VGEEQRMHSRKGEVLGPEEKERSVAFRRRGYRQPKGESPGNERVPSLYYSPNKGTRGKGKKGKDFLGIHFSSQGQRKRKMRD